MEGQLKWSFTFDRNFYNNSYHSSYRRGFLTSCWVNFTSTLMPKFLRKSRIIWSNYDHNKKSTIKDQQSKIQGYISLHVTEINDLHCMHCISHVISCIILHHFMLNFASFYVIFHTFHYTHHTHYTHHYIAWHRMSSHFSHSRIMNYFASK